ncbi:hypothetical protein LAD12857_26820 [Lacrimispora amygdalina]|uniref:SGNH/GDSL hydrolase family protein n=1 Tax=Lacrimispora amygdalina TaxID=253257 RepID=A0A3E2N8D6_9FIRM|nr:hypothetical protein [Clostridium indicum]RFZ77204.1 hypothetical protein DS742_19790 [Clostridium indicum]
MRKFGKIIGFWGIFLLLLIQSSYLFMPKKNTVEDGMADRDIHANGVLAEPSNTLDVIVVGDSEGYSAISPMVMWKDHGITSFVCSQSGQRSVEAYYMLKNALKHQNPKLVILETDLFYHHRDVQTELNHALEKMSQYYFPVFRYHDRWKKLTARDWKQEWDFSQRDCMKGFLHSKKVAAYKGGEYMNQSDGREPLDQTVTFWTDKIVKLCREKQISLLLVGVTAPKNWDYSRHNTVNDYALKNKVPYLDLNLFTKELKMDWSRDSRDGGDHLNTSGADKVSRYLGSYLAAHYGLTDHRSDLKYIEWNKELDQYLINISDKGASS